MEDGVAFEEPAGLGIDEVLQGAAGDGAEAGSNLLSAEHVDGAGLVGGEKGIGRVHGYGLVEGSHLELEGELDGCGGSDFD